MENAIENPSTFEASTAAQATPTAKPAGNTFLLVLAIAMSLMLIVTVYMIAVVYFRRRKKTYTTKYRRN